MSSETGAEVDAVTLLLPPRSIGPGCGVGATVGRAETSGPAASVEGVSPSWKSLLSNEAITQMVGHEAFARAMVYARSGHVHDVDFDDQALVITGRVKGTYRDDYEVTVYLASSRSGAVTAYRSQCSCPVALDCKHAAAVLIVARHLAAAAQGIERPEWEKTLDKLMAGVPAPAVDIAPLALEFGVERIPAFRGYVGRQDLRIRPARLGKGGHWVRTGIGWDDLDFVARSYVPEHRELLMQFRAAAGASARYALPRSAWLSLGTVSSGFWGLLDQTGPTGLSLITAQPLRGPLRVAEPATVQLDITREGAGDLRLAPRVLVDDRPLAPGTVGVLGEPAHGVFWVQPGEPGPRTCTWPGWTRCSAASCGSCWSMTGPSRFRPRTRPASGPTSAPAATEGRPGLDRRVGPPAGGRSADAGPDR